MAKKAAITKETLERYDKATLIELCLILADTSEPLMKSMQGYRKAIDDAARFLNDTNLFDEKTTSNKDDKLFDRGKVVMKELLEWQRNLKEMEALLLPSVAEDAKIVTEAREGSVKDFMK